MSRMNRRRFLETSALALSGSLLGRSVPLSAESNPSGRPNVLFIAVDDLRPQLGCYGLPEMHTPHLDKLAAGGTVFDRAYCQQAVCSPSRTSLLLGLRPDTTRVFDLKTHFRDTIPTAVTLPQQFKAHGYRTRSLGKIYHIGYDDPASWSDPSWWLRTSGYYANPTTKADIDRERDQVQAEGRDPEGKRGPSWESFDAPDEQYPDGQVATRAIESLRELKDQPFFLAVGFSKPHLPFVAPKKYYDLYPEESIRPATNPFPPKDVPSLAMMTFGELRQYSDIPAEGDLSEAKSLELIRAYYASTSFIDAQIGRILDELDRLGLRENTVVVVWGDHGWQLGDHGLWCKHTNFEVATRSPLIVRAPKQSAPGAKSPALVEFVDIYPTLCELCGVPLVPELEGHSFAPLLDDPDRKWKSAAFSQYPRGKETMGYSMRTDRYRYTEWQDTDRNPVARELYDHDNDPQENVNLAGAGDMQELVANLSKQLEAGWRGAFPK